MAREIYEELNEQLTAELPQLIDLRVPYLDPSFEALVKIQLRFCKEGYERMAQVQQYLEPQVREDYAVVWFPTSIRCPSCLLFVCSFGLAFGVDFGVGGFGSKGRAGFATNEGSEYCWKRMTNRCGSTCCPPCISMFDNLIWRYGFLNS